MSMHELIQYNNNLLQFVFQIVVLLCNTKNTKRKLAGNCQLVHFVVSPNLYLTIVKYFLKMVKLLKGKLS
jgi:hypothetical protein